MKYSENFTRDFNWYLSMRHRFTFSGDVLRTKDGQPISVQFSSGAIDGREAFFIYDSTGKLNTTKHPNILYTLLKVKASANFHVKELYAKDRANGFLSALELEEIYAEINPPDWFKKAVQNSINKYL